ncbi:GAF domain-containing protein [Alkalicaulis satelles]|uniref:GAF domain-containing protein n=1 Tax=Alkalicaulis satelles TaxID=2609175 RepID=A0A5M6ZJF2_9PROT|nr:GAF domain-containing protein [Alkalicaulis satelles]KAA5803378.1 GAF domain-containing protein [Alkalicaulis satelles]
MPHTPLFDLADPQRLAELKRFRAAVRHGGAQAPEITEAARYAFGSTVAALSCVGPQTTTFAAITGVSDPEDVPTCLAFCRHVVETGQPLIVKNLALDPRFADNPYVTEPPYIRFYAGVPVISPSGHVLGSFAILNQAPSFRFEAEDLAALKRFAQIAMNLIDMHAALRSMA